MKILDIDLGKYQVLLNVSDAEELGVKSQDRVRVQSNGDSLTAIVDITDTIVEPGEVGVFEQVQNRFDLSPGATLSLRPAERPRSVAHVKRKMKGEELSTQEIEELVVDIVDGSLTDIELSAYVTSIEIQGMNMRETVDLTRAMVHHGEKLDFPDLVVFDKHSIGGVPGNKITLLVVPIVAACGLYIPKTSSRAVTGAAGTADVMEVFCPVTLTADEIKRITLEHGGVMCWGGGVNLAPADDIIIRVEHPLSIDPRAQLLASVMAKKKAVGANHCVIDLPMGEGTKIPTMDIAKRYARDFIELGEALDIKVECAVTYGGQPVGKAVGCAVEANEALDALTAGLKGPAPKSFIDKSTSIAGILLEMGGVVPRGKGKRLAEETLES
ncbi:MAG: AMP phosphorylase, partial [Methanobacteriota archaeon]